MSRRSSEAYDNMEAILRRAHKEGKMSITGMTFADAWRLKQAFNSFIVAQRTALKSIYAPEDRKVKAKEILELRADLVISVERIKPQDGGHVNITLRECAPINQAMRRALAIKPGTDRPPTRNEILGALEAELNTPKAEANAPKLR